MESPLSDQSSSALVVGATGRAGSAYVRSLREAGYAVKGTLRPGNDPSALLEVGAIPVEADLRQSGALTDVVEGVDAVFLAIFGRDPDPAADEFAITRNVLTTAANGGVKHIVFTSVLHADRVTGVPHFDAKASIEEDLREAGATYTILRPCTFMDGFSTPWFKQPIEQEGVLRTPFARDTPISYLDTADLGTFGRLALEDDRLANTAVELGGPEAVTPEDLRSTLERVLGRSIAYQQVPIEQVEATAGPDVAAMIRYFNENGFTVDAEPTARRFGVALTTVERFLTRSGWGRTTAQISG